MRTPRSNPTPYPQTDGERAALLQLALRYRSARQIAAEFRNVAPHCKWTTANVKHYARSGEYYDWRIPTLLRIVERGQRAERRS